MPQEDPRRVPAATEAAEKEGYDGIVAPENQHDPFPALAVAGAATPRIELHTRVVIAFAHADGGPRGWLGSRCYPADHPVNAARRRCKNRRIAGSASSPIAC